MRTPLYLALVALVLFVWLAMEVREGHAIRFDPPVREFVHSFASPGLTAVMEFFTRLGTFPVTVPVAGAVLLALWFTGRRQPAVFFVVTVAGSAVLMNVLKLLFHRKRPEAYFGFPLPTNFSFPSGHALGAICFWGALALIASAEVKVAAGRVAIWLAAALLTLAIGVSRIYLGVHYPSDVAGGYLSGAVWLWVVCSRWFGESLNRGPGVRISRPDA